ncbi:hypothetical protein [Thalassobellus suaedae]|uniref:Uncharacterized protein n=1 Tax=Thalassobellus suaedae TaxID=3074124 RepID=A0ABY9Y012_9FLAO|nr:hypothetical protein RHP49_10070 [Flavobacteriaceae bacterium HL-DH10]
MKGRAKRKTITQIMMLKLIEIAQEEGEPELEKSYWNTYYCQQNLLLLMADFMLSIAKIDFVRCVVV